MRFGMFIHWGLYAIPARGEWVMSNEKMSVQQYKKYFDEFNPTDFDAKRWASVCRQAGMKYAVLTAKHHDGFCLFDSKLTEYKSTNTRFGRDIVREFLEAFRAEGIAVGLYFSLLDWSHPDFPKYADRHHPMRGREEYCGEQIDFDNYLNFMHGQVKELVTGYGKLDLLWFDFSYDDMAGEKWRASDLISMVRKYQPNVCIDNRLEGSGEKYRGAEVDATLLPKVKVEVIGGNIPVEKVIETAKKCLYTGHIGDGKIFVYDVRHVVKVRTGEEDLAALKDVE